MSEVSEHLALPQFRVPCFHATDFQIRVSERECQILFCRSSFSLDPSAPRSIEPVLALNLSPQSGIELSKVLKNTFEELKSKSAINLDTNQTEKVTSELSNNTLGTSDLDDVREKNCPPSQNKKGTIVALELHD